MYSGKHAYRQFLKDLGQDKLPGVVLLYGKEQFLVDWAVKAIKEKYVNPASSGMDYVVIDEDDVEQGNTVDRIIEACETFSILSDRRVVKVRNLKALKTDDSRAMKQSEVKRLADYIAVAHEGTMLVFQGEDVNMNKILPSAIQEAGISYNMTQLERPELRSFAAKRFRQNGTAISDGDIAFLIDETGYYHKESDYDLYTFNNDINKLIALSQGESVDREMIRSIVESDAETFVFDLLESISSGKRGRAFTLLGNHLSEDGDAFGLISMIVSQFELMLSVKQMRENGLNLSNMQSKLKVKEYRIKKLLPYTERFTVSRLKTILSSAYEMDRKIKTGVLRERMALELFVASI